MTPKKKVLFLKLKIGIVLLIAVGVGVDHLTKQSNEGDIPAQPVNVVENKIRQYGDKTFILADKPDPRCGMETSPDETGVLYINAYNIDRTVCCVRVAGTRTYDISISDIVYDASPTRINVMRNQGEDQVIDIF